MLPIIVSDIFGKTPVIEEIARPLPGQTDILDPYGSKFMNFEDESRAYDFYMQWLCEEIRAGVKGEND